MEHRSMAHANPEFALGCRAWRDPPLRYRVSGPPTTAALRARIDAIGLMPAADRTPDQQRALDAWIAFQRRTRGHEPAWAEEPGAGMHGGHKRGERFHEPRRRFGPVQAGRVKRDCRGNIC